ncbi:MAG TPA: 16S rRNA (adenine(1518)-N(6)/adenine(1519)-N(6))-dimethyltransferase RsmA [Bdellovibrionota bacterium]|jgi:16S rRNA (adenine1518-N6/adenine1519-N6)-dimethyltransferase|nr:16S rRNA (adenine(1518)-N(6)/adenine(1519)-N(6))-dimethyltransferase RsmA [Bdellovibrionota bacterium]
MRESSPKRPFSGERKRRAFGQHFLKDASVIRETLDAFLQGARALGAKSLVEIGPGGGALTDPLLQAWENWGPNPPALRLFERDRDIASGWRERAEGKGWSVVEGDFMDAPDSTWSEPAPVAVLSNLPYSAGTAIAQRLLAAGPHVPFAVLMFQAEVGRRFRAPAGDSDRGSLSVWAQNFWDIDRIKFVPPGAFKPPPKVNSEVLRFRRRAEPRIQGSAEHPELWQRLIKTAFAQRRKMLRSNFAQEPWKQALVRSKVDGTLRAQALDWPDWQALLASAVEG